MKANNGRKRTSSQGHRPTPKTSKTTGIPTYHGSEISRSRGDSRPAKASGAAAQADTLSTLLSARQLTQAALAGALQVDPSYISHIVLGRKQPSLRRATRMARALGVSLDEFQRAVRASEHRKAANGR